jgi:hypothetical protein
LRLLKKSMIADGGTKHEVPASEKLEIIYLVEQSHLPARRTPEMVGIKPSTVYHCYDRFRFGRPEVLQDKLSKPDRVWNRIRNDIHQRIVSMALDQPELSHASWQPGSPTPTAITSRNHQFIGS